MELKSVNVDYHKEFELIGVDYISSFEKISPNELDLWVEHLQDMGITLNNLINGRAPKIYERQQFDDIRREVFELPQSYKLRRRFWLWWDGPNYRDLMDMNALTNDKEHGIIEIAYTTSFDIVTDTWVNNDKGKSSKLEYGSFLNNNNGHLTVKNDICNKVNFTPRLAYFQNLRINSFSRGKRKVKAVEQGAKAYEEYLSKISK